MDLIELKKFLKVDGSDLDTVLTGYQLAAEIYLQNAGVKKDYDNALYKIVITIFVGTLLENPSLIVTGTITGEVKSVTLNVLIAQLRLCQVTT